MKIVTEISNENLLINADLFRLASMAFSYPDHETVESIRTITNGLIVNPTLNDNLVDILQSIHREIDEDAIRLEYSRVFIKSGLALAESCYILSTQTVSDVSAYYAAFGFSPRSGEVPDSLIHELEFAAILLLKEALAETFEQKDVTRKAFASFRESHLLEFSMKFESRLSDGDASVYFRKFAELVKEIVE